MQFREVIRREFHKKKNRDHGYSLCRFAQDLEMTPAEMKRIFRGRRGLSARQALRLAWRLGLKGFAARRFCFSVSL